MARPRSGSPAETKAAEEVEGSRSSPERIGGGAGCRRCSRSSAVFIGTQRRRGVLPKLLELSAKQRVLGLLCSALEGVRRWEKAWV